MIVLLGMVMVPAKMDEIPALPDVGPTILYSSILGWMSRPDDGKSGCTFLPDAGPYARPTFS